MNIPALFCIDSYKLGHADQYPEGITKVYSNFTPRSAKHFLSQGFERNDIVFFGLQVLLTDMQDSFSEFFSSPKEQVLNDFKETVLPFVGPNGINMKRFEALHDLGYLPVCIKALPEGSYVPVGVPVLTITNTHDDFFWIVNYLETWISCELWKMCTSATIADSYKQILMQYNQETCDNSDFTPFQIHDFSVRGMSGINDAAKTGMGHLLSSLGSDNIPAVVAAKYYYDAEGMVACSVPASEHSTASSNILNLSEGISKLEAEKAFLKKYITEIYPSGICSYVTDTYDYFGVLSEVVPQLKEEILNRQPDSLGIAKVVFRPDSGDPQKIICGYRVVDEEVLDQVLDQDIDNIDMYDVVKSNGKYYFIDPIYETDYDYEYCIGYDMKREIQEAEALGSVRTLDKIFGSTVNSKGYKTLNPRVGLIYGDSITLERCKDILQNLKELGYSSDNIVFGVGSYTYNYQTRDTFGFAMKATYVEINGKGQEIFKDPKTDNGTKKSAKGLLRVIKKGSKYILLDQQGVEGENEGELKPVFFNGELFTESFEEIKERLSNLFNTKD